MNFLSVVDTAKKWNMSERTVRNYCAENKISGAFLTGKTWNIPENAEKPDRINKRHTTPVTLLEILKAERKAKVSGGIYHRLEIELTYDSNHIEGSRLTYDQTRHIFETNTVEVTEKPMNVDDIVETANHFECIDMILSQAKYPLSESFIKELHLTLKNGTSDARHNGFAVGDYKKTQNEVGGMAATAPEKVAAEMSALLADYNAIKEKTLEDILDFHVRFESIHPFQDGSGRVGRLIMFKECLRKGIVPFIIGEDMKLQYYRGLHEWYRDRRYLMETCLEAQKKFKKYLDYFKIAY